MSLDINRSSIFKQFETIGLIPGDVVLLKANLASIGIVNGDPKNGFLNALIDYLGSGGTVVAAAFTKTHFLPFINKHSKIFTIETQSNTGGLSKIMLKNLSSVRSSHPTNSFVGIGKYAHDILRDHNEKSHSFAPIEKIMAIGGKGLMIGCLKSSPGHLTAHLAQYHLGQSKKNFFSGLAGATYYKDKKLKVFLRKDFGGHAAGAIKFYEHYEKANAIQYSEIGNANAGISNLKQVYDIEKELFKKDPKYILCNDPLCFSCRASWKYNVKDLPGYVVRKLYQILRNKIS
tara:strand:+ start:3122 stop:3988 length:867 start_codon:yes stop_codon:yes gene_type:complete